MHPDEAIASGTDSVTLRVPEITLARLDAVRQSIAARDRLTGLPTRTEVILLAINHGLEALEYTFRTANKEPSKRKVAKVKR